MIDIRGLSKAKVLAALYNNSKPLGMGHLQYDPKPMTEIEAEEILATGVTSFDYLKGRVIKVNISGDEFKEYCYDRDNGEGAALRVIESLRNGD